MFAVGGLQLIAEKPTNSSCWREIRVGRFSFETAKVRETYSHWSKQMSS